MTYYHAHGLGSIVAVTDQDGDVVKSYDYDPWGNRTESGTLTVDGVDYAFTGREWDAETGLYYYRARYYDPRIGRFISEDPIRRSPSDCVKSWPASRSASDAAHPVDRPPRAPRRSGVTCCSG